MSIYFQEDGTDRVYVVGARGARGLELTVASEVFEESGRSPVRGTLDYLQGLKVCASHLCFVEILSLWKEILNFSHRFDLMNVITTDAWSEASRESTSHRHYSDCCW
jgi:hypothetical protein